MSVLVAIRIYFLFARGLCFVGCGSVGTTVLYLKVCVCLSFAD